MSVLQARLRPSEGIGLAPMPSCGGDAGEAS